MDRTFKTSMTKGSTRVETVATIDFAGVTQEQLEELAAASVIIMQQAIYRAGSIPATDTIKVLELLKRERKAFVPTPENMLAKASKMTEAERQKLIELLSA